MRMGIILKVNFVMEKRTVMVYFDIKTETFMKVVLGMI